MDQEYDSDTRKRRRRAIDIHMLLSENDDAERGIDPRLPSALELWEINRRRLSMLEAEGVYTSMCTLM